jgi:C4-dicarboxylate transporter, DctQ subunit
MRRGKGAPSFAMLQKVRNILGRLLEWVLIALMVTLTVIVIVAVFYRKFGDSLSWYDEVASVMLAWITYYGAALAALRRRHIGLDSVLLALPLPARMWAVALAEALILAFFAALAWAGFEVIQVLRGDTLVSLTWVSVQFTQSVIPIGAVLFIVAELLSLPSYWRATRDGVSLDHLDVEEG